MSYIILIWLFVLGASVTLGFIAFSLFRKKDTSIKEKVIAIGSIVLIVMVFMGATFGTSTISNSESVKRFQKSISSEFKGGITREITVYLENGDIIYNDIGKFDVEYQEGRLKWVDESGKLQIIYVGNTSTAVVTEI